MATSYPNPATHSATTPSPATGGSDAPAHPVDFEFDDPGFQADPYPTYALLRERDPICHRERDGLELYFLTRYRDIVSLLRHPQFSAARTPSDMMAPGVPEKFRRLGHLLTQMMLMKDAPDHTRLRGLVNKAFSPRVVQGLRPRIEAIVEELLAAVRSREDGPGRSQLDILHDLATPLPVIVIAERWARRRLRKTRPNATNLLQQIPAFGRALTMPATVLPGHGRQHQFEPDGEIIPQAQSPLQTADLHLRATANHRQPCLTCPKIPVQNHQ